MILHNTLGDTPFKRSRQLQMLINQDKISLAGNSKLKIYGRLNCASGKRMKLLNRVFFLSEEEAVEKGYRPCGHCMRTAYKDWKLLQRYIY